MKTISEKIKYILEDMYIHIDDGHSLVLSPHGIYIHILSAYELKISFDNIEGISYKYTLYNIIG